MKKMFAKMHSLWLLATIFLLASRILTTEASLAMKRLYEDLFTDYNRLVLPVTQNNTKIVVTLGLKLGQILDFNLKSQILSTNVWVEQTWHDHRLGWDPTSYEGIDMIHVPAENIWIPDIVLFNNADGNYELTLFAKAILYANGTIVWKPPTMFRSTCEVDVEYFPFDIQTCFLRFGSWTYAGDEVEIKHIANKRKVDVGIDLSQFYKNVEWDIIDVPAYYNEVYYECCNESFPDVTFKIVIRRKMLFYLVNLILPVALMTFMTVSVFYLPSDSNEKVTLSISILTSLIVFFLLMLEIIPPTSLAVPLFGKYLLFTLVLVSLSACVSVYVLNIHHRSPAVHKMSPRMRQLFLKTLPRLLRLDRPDPRERSSLNRFRKKKLAQQMLQARQHNKVYDLAQPLATSLNLIETLHKSYDFNPRDDIKGSEIADQSDKEKDEGRYFRKYIDDYITNLGQNYANAGRSGMDGFNPLARIKDCNCNEGRPDRECCEHRKCCSMANNLAPHQIINDDTLDMTFDEQDNICGNGFTVGASVSKLAEDDLPSPPPPPRQLTHLSDSMKELSGRLSSCSGQQRTFVGASSSKLFPYDDDDLDDEEIDRDDMDEESKTVDHGRLVDKLFNSINMINASEEIDTTTTSNNEDDRDYLKVKPNNSFCNGAVVRNKVPIATLVNGNSCDDTNKNFKGQQTGSASQVCLCKPSSQGSDQVRKPSDLLLSLRLPYDKMPPHVRAAIRSILFIADSIKNEDDENSAIEDWESMSMVVDRLFLWIFFILCTFGSLIILALAPSLYDQRDSIDDKLRIDIPLSNCSALLYAHS